MTAIIAAKRGHLCQEVCYQTRCSSQWNNTMKIYCATILSTCFNPKELKVTPKDQIYTKPSH